MYTVINMPSCKARFTFTRSITITKHIGAIWGLLVNMYEHILCKNVLFQISSKYIEPFYANRLPERIEFGKVCVQFQLYYNKMALNFHPRGFHIIIAILPELGKVYLEY